MRIGICSMPEQAKELEAIGYDYVEWPLSRTIGNMSDQAYKEIRQLAATLGIGPEAWNVMLPAELKVVGPELDLQGLRDYLTSTLGRASKLGGEVVVFGSGGARRIPEGYPSDEAHRQFEEACEMAGDVAEKLNLNIAIEPLNRGETNLVNSVKEAVEIVNRIDHPAVQVLSDLYHVTVEAESLTETKNAGDLLAHVHIAAPDRSIPLPGQGEQELLDYFAALRDIGYDGRVSIEAKWTDMDDAAAALHLVRGAWDSH